MKEDMEMKMRLPKTFDREAEVEVIGYEGAQAVPAITDFRSWR